MRNRLRSLRRLGRFGFPGPSEDFQARGGGKVVTFTNQVASGRNAAIRAGWNDAAWGRPHRELEAAQAPWYERGYADGLVFRQKQQSDLAERAVVSRTLPRVVPAGTASRTPQKPRPPNIRKQAFPEQIPEKRKVQPHDDDHHEQDVQHSRRVLAHSSSKLVSERSVWSRHLRSQFPPGGEMSLC